MIFYLTNNKNEQKI